MWESGVRKMKKVKTGLLAALLPAILLLSSCGNAVLGDPASASPAGEASGEVGRPAASETMTFQAEDVKSAAVTLTDEEVLAAYDRAVAAYGWFRLKTLPCDDASAIVEGSLYQRVDYAGIGTIEELRTYLRGIFSQEVIDQLLPEDDSVPLYRDIDGQLYVIPSSRQPDPYKGTEAVTVEHPSEDTFTVNVTVDILAEDMQTIAGIEGYSFPYQYVDGRWVFTSFKLVNEPS